MQTLNNTETLQKIITGYKVIDVRAPVEFAQGSLPGSVNIPVLDDHERALVGTCYKNEGRESAVDLGYKMVSGANLQKKRDQWAEFIKNNPRAMLTCFRGGLRSKNTQSFLSEAGFSLPRVEHGYKGMRSLLSSYLNEYAQKSTMRILSGNTGSGKTLLLKSIHKLYPVVDLEMLAQHRGSAFGKLPGRSQPAQATFENALAVSVFVLDQQSTTPVLYEDESRVIGSLHLPELFFEKMRASSVVKLQVSIEKRIENIFNDYINLEEFKDPALVDVIFNNYLISLQRISRKLGGQRAAELKLDLDLARGKIKEGGPAAANKDWIEKFLVWYYDPMYEYSLAVRNPRVEFAGNEFEVSAYLQSLV